jgi:hypothetical protein
MIVKGRGSAAADNGTILATLLHGRLSRSLKKQGIRSVFHA